MSQKSFELFRGKLMGAQKYMALKAFSIAERAHAGVMRKDGVTPYIEHPIKVASLLFELGVQDDKILAVAILHDVLEDCDDTVVKDDLFKSFDTSTIRSIGLLSKSKNYNNTEYYNAIANDPVATLVKLADRAHNLSTVYNFSEEKKLKYINETIEFVYPLISHAQHTYYEYSSQLRILDIMIESIVKNVEPYLK